MDVDGVTADVGSDDRADSGPLSQVPDLDVPIPAAGDDEVRVLLYELGAEDTI